MHQINTTGSCGLVLDTDSRSTFTGHFVLKRYHVDDDGHVCLTPSLPLSGLRGSIEVLTAELESLLEQAKQRFPETTRAL